MREFYEGCQKNPLRHEEYKHTTNGTVNGVTLFAKSNAGTLPPQTLEGEFSPPPKDGVTLKFSWKLTRAAPKLMARISAPGFFKRGDLVTLDGSGSLGDITEYSWRFDLGENCAPAYPANPLLVLKGPKQQFRALCDFRAHLDVKDATGAGDHTKVSLKVQAREGAEWKTHFSRKAGPAMAKRLLSEYLHFGVNQCAKHSGDETTGHMLHTTVENNRTWLPDGYESAQVSDSGPFNTLWFVSKQHLEIDRVERVNSSLLPGGEVYALNQRKGNLAAVQALAAQVKAHETAHSDLLSEALQQLGSEGDPAHQVEAVLGTTEEILQTFADMKVREVETNLRDATSDDHVKQRLQGQSGFSGTLSVWVPTTDNTEVKKDLGLLWAIGE